MRREQARKALDLCAIVGYGEGLARCTQSMPLGARTVGSEEAFAAVRARP